MFKKIDRNFLENNEKLKKLSIPSIKFLDTEKMLRHNPRRNEFLDDINKSAHRNREESKEREN